MNQGLLNNPFVPWAHLLLLMVHLRQQWLGFGELRGPLTTSLDQIKFV